MGRCSGIKRDGGRCEGVAVGNSDYCYQHDPDRADERRRNASKGGKRGGRGRPQVELTTIKETLSRLADDVLQGNVERGVGAVVSQILNVYLSAIRTELKAKEVAELEARLEELEQALEQRGSRYGT